VPRPRLYNEDASWFHTLTHPDSYVEEAAIFRGVFEQHARPVRTILELGSGGGNNASHLKAHFEMTLTDLSAGMLEVSKSINPELEHILGDMRTLRLDRTFDAVFAHDAIAYMTTEADLAAALVTAAVHLEPGGLALFVPDDTQESYRRKGRTGGHSVGERSMRYEEWDDPVAEGATVVRTNFVYTVSDGSTQRTETDVHETGLFPRATWLSLIEAAGLQATMLPYRHSEFAADDDHELFCGVK
jgi:SAM-dependent methyltransferase